MPTENAALTPEQRIEVLEGIVQHLLREQEAMRKHVHEQNPGGITSRPRKDKPVSRRQHREVVPL